MDEGGRKMRRRRQVGVEMSIFGRRGGTRWMKLSVTRERLMHYAKDRIARFARCAADRSTSDRLSQDIRDV